MGKHYLELSFVVVPLLLISVGLVCLYSASTALDQTMLRTPFGRQLIWFVVGLFGFVFLFLTPLRLINQWAYFFYGSSLIFLVLVLLVGSGSARRWIDVGFFQFQPSEIVKMSTIVVLGKYLSDWKESRLNFTQLCVIALFVGMIAVFPFGILGLVFIAALGILMIKVVKERLQNKEDDYYNKEVDK